MSIEEKIAEIIQKHCWESLKQNQSLNIAREILDLPAEGWVVPENYLSEDMQYPEEHHSPATLRDILDGKAVKG